MLCSTLEDCTSSANQVMGYKLKANECGPGAGLGASNCHEVVQLVLTVLG